MKDPNPWTNKHTDTLTLAQTPKNPHQHTHIHTHPQDTRRAGGGKGVSHESINPV